MIRTSGEPPEAPHGYEILSLPLNRERGGIASGLCICDRCGAAVALLQDNSVTRLHDAWHQTFGVT